MVGKWLRISGTMFALLAATCSTLLGWGIVASAESSNRQITWDDALSAKMTAEELPGAMWRDWYQPFCQPAMAIVEDFTSRQEREVCYVSSTNAQLAVFRKEAGGVTYYALKKNGDDAFHRIAQQFPDSSNFVLLPNDTIIGSKQGGEGYKMFSLSNFQEHASADAISSGTPNDYIVYELSTAAGTLFTDGVGNSFPVRHIAVSRNGKYAVAQTLGRGLARIDVTTRSVKIISNDYANSNAGVVLAISNDGNTVAVTGTGSLKHRVYVGLDDCGSINATSIIADRNMCYFADLSEAVASRLGDTVFYNPELSDDNRLLTIRAWSEAEQKARKLTFTPDADNYRLE